MKILQTAVSCVMDSRRALNAALNVRLQRPLNARPKSTLSSRRIRHDLLDSKWGGTARTARPRHRRRQLPCINTVSTKDRVRHDRSCATTRGGRCDCHAAERQESQDPTHRRHADRGSETATPEARFATATVALRRVRRFVRHGRSGSRERRPARSVPAQAIHTSPLRCGRMTSGWRHASFRCSKA